MPGMPPPRWTVSAASHDLVVPPARILIVCVGNICRSPIAERLLQARLDAAAPGAAFVTSAGTRATDGREMDPAAAGQLARLGAGSTHFRATRLTSDMVAEADLVLTATKDLRTDVLRLAPRAMRRTFTLAEFAAICAEPQEELLTLAAMVHWAATRRSLGADAIDIVDPYGESMAIHVRSADQTQAIIDLLAPAIASAMAIPT